MDRTEDPASGLPTGAAEAPRTRGRVVAFIGIWAVIGLGLAEVAARALIPPRVDYFPAHPYTRHMRRPDLSPRYLDPFERKPFVMQIDGHGFRSRGLEPPGVPKPQGSYRVFFVGASTTENVALPDEKTWPALVEDALNRSTGGSPRVVGVNAGVSGNVIADNFSLIAHRILTLEPDLIVYMDCANDMRFSMTDRFDPVRNMAVPLEPEPLRLSKLLARASRLYDAFDRVRESSDAERADRSRERRRQSPFSQGLDPLRGLPHFRRYLGMISAVCREAGVPLALMTQPALHKEAMTPEEDAALYLGLLGKEVNIDTPTLIRGQRAFNQAVRDLARERGHLLIDLEEVVPRDLEHFYDDWHYTARGCQVMAEHISAALLRHGVPAR